MQRIWRAIQTFWQAILAASAWVGLLFLPKDIQETPEAAKEWGAIMPSIDRETALIVFSGLLVLWIVWTDIRPYAQKWFIQRWHPIEIIFPNEINSEAKYGLNKYGVMFLPHNGSPNDVPITELSYLIGVKNNSRHTLHNLHMIVQYISKPGSFPMLELPANIRESQTKISLQPNKSIFFHFCTGIYNSPAEHVYIDCYNKPHYKILKNLIDHSYRVFIPKVGNNIIPLLPNNGYEVNVIVYADDVRSIEAKFRIDAKDKLCVHLKDVNPSQD